MVQQSATIHQIHNSVRNVTVVAMDLQWPTCFGWYSELPSEWLDHSIWTERCWSFGRAVNGCGNMRNNFNIVSKLKLKVVKFPIKRIGTYITGNTLGKTTLPSAKYWYKTRVSFSLDVYLTSVANTVNTNACVDKSGITSGSSKTFDSFDTDDREPRSCVSSNAQFN